MADFSVTVQPPASVAAGEDETFTVRFDPQSSGLRTALVTIASSDPNEDPFTFLIQGTGTEPAGPEIAVIGLNFLAITNGAFTPESANGTDFGQILTNTAPVDLSIAIENNGLNPLNLNGAPAVQLFGDPEFSVLLQPLGPIPSGRPSGRRSPLHA